MVSVIKGASAKIFDSEDTTYTELGWAESCSMDIDASVDEFLVVGETQPKAIAEGPAVLSGSLSEAWVDNTMVGRMYGDGTAQIKWNIYAYRNVAPKLYVWAYDCLIESFSLDVPADGFVTHDIDFRGTYWRYGSF